VGGVRASLNNVIYGYSSDGVNVGDDAVWIGCYLLDIQGVVDNYKTFCMDLRDDVTFSYTEHTAYNTLSSIESMWGTFYDEVVTDPVKAGAFQLAVWELVHETNTTKDVSSGAFHMESLNTSSGNNNGATYADLVTLANYYVNSANWTTSADLIMLDDGTYQPFVVAVPEPATIGLLAFCSLSMLRRKLCR
jgi:hypothetical protein